jgi:hypothetical protein
MNIQQVNQQVACKVEDVVDSNPDFSENLLCLIRAILIPGLSVHDVREDKYQVWFPEVLQPASDHTSTISCDSESAHL